jgi:hypothetical protein
MYIIYLHTHIRLCIPVPMHVLVIYKMIDKKKELRGSYGKQNFSKHLV